MYAHNYIECPQKVFRYTQYRAMKWIEVDIFLIYAA